VFPVLDAGGQLIGLVVASTLRVAAADLSNTDWALATDVMQAPVSVQMEDDLRGATEAMLVNGLRELPVVDEARRVIGLLGESDVAELYLQAALRAESSEVSAAAPSSSIASRART